MRGRLTSREAEATYCRAMGMTYEEIGDRLDVSASTAHTHVRRAREKYEEARETVERYEWYLNVTDRLGEKPYLPSDDEG